MRILMLSIVDPSVHKGGAWTSTREVTRLLREGPLKAEVDVLACRDYSGFSRRRRQAWAVARSLFSRLPAKIEFTRSHEMLVKMRALLSAQPYDLIFLNGTDLLWLLPDLPSGVPRLLLAHNIESELFASQVQTGILSLPVIHSLVERECRRLRNYEIEGLRRVGRVLFLSASDESYARERCPGLETMVLPPVFGYPPVRRPCPGAAQPVNGDSPHLEIGMLANFHWWPNRRGLEWFLRDVFPHVPSHVRVHLFGYGSESACPRHPRIVAHGLVDDLREVWTTCGFMICPIFSGGGVCVKVAEALYNGMPLLGTNKAVRGLSLEPDPGIKLLDTAGEWIEFMQRDAVSLAKQCIPTSLSMRFAAGNYAEALSEFCARPIVSTETGPRRMLA